MSIGKHPPAQPQDSAPPPTPWQFVRLGDYRLPGPLGATAALERWASLKRIFGRGSEPELPPVKAEADLRALSQSRLQNLARPIDWRCAVPALNAVLAEWQQAAPVGEAVRFVIGQPHCGHAQILAQWAADHRAAMVEAPSVDRLLGDDGRWLDDWPAADRLWVLPNLEQCYLRHADGLGLVRSLLERAASGALGRGVIGCDSWAWAYLRRVWPLPQPAALTLQAFDGPRLSRYLAELVSCPGRDCLHFRNATTGKELRLEPGSGDAEVSPEVNYLAVHSRGNIGVALHSWRSALRAVPEQEQQVQPEAPAEVAASLPAAVPDAEVDDIVWVSTALREPVLPAEGGEAMVFLLHGLLLHNGLPASLLPELLPQPRHRIASCLLELQALGVVVMAGERWQVSVAAYSVVREFLRRRGFLRDDF